MKCDPLVPILFVILSLGCVYFAEFLFFHTHTARNLIEIERVKDDDFHANLIVDQLYLGSYHSILQVDHLKANNITHIVSIANGMTSPPAGITTTSQFTFLVVRAFDSSDTFILEHLPLIWDFIEEGKKEGGSVLVHCMAGVSRSATVVISYLIKSKDWNFHKALQYVRQKRPVVNPARGFINQLKEVQEINKFGFFDKYPLDTSDNEIDDLSPLYPRKITTIRRCDKGELGECRYLLGSRWTESFDEGWLVLKYFWERFVYRFHSITMQGK